MPALVVWERLIVAGDDLRLNAVFVSIIRLLQIFLVIFILYSIIQFDHQPELFVMTGCLSHEDNYWMWYNFCLAGCVIILIYTLVGAVIEAAIYTVSGRGTPTQQEKRRILVPLCKFNMVPMLILRTCGLIFAVWALLLTDRDCNCVADNLPQELLEGDGARTNCPNDGWSWYVAARLLMFTIVLDVLVPAIMLIVVLRQRIVRLYRRVRPPRERSLEDVQRSWQLTCKHCCECCSLMTCYMCGGQKLTAGSYADVAIALTDFLDAKGSLDIVASDVAAALICLVNIQKQKQNQCKNELLREGGIFAKDRGLASRLYRQFIKSNDSMVMRQESMRQISSSLRKLSMTSNNSSEDMESGLARKMEFEEDFYWDAAVSEGDRHQQYSWDAAVSEQYSPNVQSTSSSSLRPTQLEELRQSILVGRNTNNTKEIDFRVSHIGNKMSFVPTISTVLCPEKSFDCLVLGEGSRYCAVALASYSWMMYVWTHKCTGCCELTANSIYGVCTCHPRCSCCYSNDNIIGDDMCGWKEASVLKTIGIEESDVFYANFCNDVGKNPYLILRDRQWKTIVLTIRGTLSFEDMVSDVTISPQSLEELGEQFGFDGKGEYCHSGMLAGAQSIYDDLKRHKILDEAMEAHSEYGLRIVGHSLGAGVAAVLGRMMKQQYPNLYCLSFSPPGCVFSERTALECKDYVCSFVLHNDIVPRLSFDSLVNLRNDLLEIIARIKVPKHQVFDSNWTVKDPEQFSDLLHDASKIPQTQFFTDFERFKASQNERQELRDTAHIKMTVPGRILQMVRTSVRLDNVPCSCMSSCLKSLTKCLLCYEETKQYKVRWIDAEDLGEIYISPTMMVDHFPYNVARALECCASAYGVDDQPTTAEHDKRIIFEEAKR